MESLNRMKKRFISELQPGEAVDDLFVLAEKAVLQKKDGDNYLNLVFSDRTGRMRGVVWDQVDRIQRLFNTGDVARVKATVGEYRGALQLIVKDMAVVETASIDYADFITASERNIEALLERVIALTESFTDSHLQELLRAFWRDDDFVRQFKAAPAAKMMHHAYLGGLLEHTLSMAVLADRIAGHYTGVNRDLLVTGALLHDIGKIKEFRYDSVIDYSDEGRMLNHITLGVQLLEEKIRALPDFPAEKALLLKHMVISHHGSRDLGSPEPPKTIEAVLLNYIDEIDSKIHGIRDFMNRENSEAPWTAYHRLLERHFYRGK
jgi:3'-5' exoribonuclease